MCSSVCEGSPQAKDSFDDGNSFLKDTRKRKHKTEKKCKNWSDGGDRRDGDQIIESNNKEQENEK